MNNKILKIQEIIMRELERLDDNTYMQFASKTEIARGNAISQNACSFIKSINVGLRIMETAKDNKMQVEVLNKALGIVDEK